MIIKGFLQYFRGIFREKYWRNHVITFPRFREKTFVSVIFTCEKYWRYPVITFFAKISRKLFSRKIISRFFRDLLLEKSSNNIFREKKREKYFLRTFSRKCRKCAREERCRTGPRQDRARTAPVFCLPWDRGNGATPPPFSAPEAHRGGIWGF